MASHIATPESFMAGGHEFEGTCAVCQWTGTLRVGWLDVHCPNCDSYMSREAPTRTVRRRREWMGLSIQEMADLMGLKRATVKQYETRWPSRKYWDATKQAVSEHNASTA